MGKYSQVDLSRGTRHEDVWSSMYLDKVKLRRSEILDDWLANLTGWEVSQKPLLYLEGKWRKPREEEGLGEVDEEEEEEVEEEDEDEGEEENVIQIEEPAT